MERTMDIKKETTQVEIPSKTISKTLYCCGHCNFRSSYESDVKKHYAKEHTAKKKIANDFGTFLYFDSEEDYDLYGDYDKDYFHNNWVGEGWYKVERYSRPCSRGCCTDECVTYRHVRTEKLNLEVKIHELEIKISKIGEEIRFIDEL